MRMWWRFKQFLADDRGVIISTERIVVLTLVVSGMVVGVLSLRNALTNHLLDEVDAMATCTNMIVFNPAEVEIMTTIDFGTLFPGLAIEAERPVPTPASKESQ